MKRLSESQKQRMEDEAQIMGFLISLAGMLILAFLFVLFFPSIAAVMGGFMDWVVHWGGYEPIRL